MSTRKIALLTGISGQDASLMAELLLNKNYKVHGIVRRASNFNTQRIDHIFDRITLHFGDLTDSANIISIIKDVQPDEIYNFAAQSHVKVSCELENYTFQTNTMGLLNILQGVKILGLDKKTKVYQASTSEMFGCTGTDGTKYLTENSPLVPVSPYGISKVAAHHLANYYRDAFGMFVVSSILLNHEGPRRGPTFVTQKIARHVGRYKVIKDMCEKIGKECASKPLQLGNLNAKRDWGSAKDYMRGVYMSMQHNKPDNYLLATGEEHSVREFVEVAFEEVGVKVEWEGSNENEKGVCSITREVLVQVNPRYYRPIDIEHLVGDYSKAKNVLGWEPRVKFDELVKEMVIHQVELAKKEFK